MSAELPAGWHTLRLGDISRDISYGFTASSANDADGPKMLRITDIQDNRVRWSSVPRCECPLPQKYLLDVGDIVVARTGATTGKSFLIREVPEPAVFASYLIRVRPSDAVTAEYLSGYMQSPTYWAQISVVSKGTAQPGANASILSDLEVPVPPLDVQRRIVTKLESLQARSRRAREALDAVPPLLEKLRQSILAAAFRGDLTKDWRAKNKDVEPATELLKRIRIERRKKWEESELAKMKAKGKAPTDARWKAKYREPEPVDTEGLPELPEGWCWASVEEVGLIESGQTTDGLAEHGSSNTRDVPWFRVGDMNHADNEVLMRASEVWLSKDDVRRFGLHVRPAGTIVFPKRGGAIATNKKRRLAQASAYDLNTMGIVPVDSWADYVWAWFQAIDLGRLNTGTSVPQINHGDIAPLPVPVAPVGEAAVISTLVVAHLAGLRANLARIARMGLRIGELDRATLSKAFLGELADSPKNR